MGAYGSPEIPIPPRQTPVARRAPRRAPYCLGILTGGCSMLLLELAALVILAVCTYHGRH